MKLKQFIFAFTAMLLCFTVSVNAQVAKIGGTEYTTLADALDAAKAKTGDVTVELYEKVTLNQPLNGSFTTITFVGKDTDAEIYLDVQGYITATNKKVAFKNLTLSKSQGGFITNAGFMNVAFGVYDVAEVTYTNCTFANGAYASSGKVTFNGCTFKKSWDKYGLWAYGNVDVTVQGSTFADYRGIKMYAENGADASVEKANLTVKNTNFSAVDNKPAIVLTYGESVVLEGNTYSSTGTFELDLDGKPNGVAVTSDVAPTCVNDNGACGVLVDGKIYTTVAQAAEVATAGSTVTLLHNSTETVKFPEGVTLNKNGFTANGVTVVAEAKIGDVEYATLQAALDAAAAGTGNVTVAILADVNLTGVDWNPVTVSAPGYPVVTVEGNGKTITGLNDMLFAGTWAGKSGLIIKNITIENSAIVNDKDDAAGNVGVGAFIGYPQASATITLENCHLKNSSVEGGHWTGGLIGMAGGYNGADGPVFMNLTIKGCSVTGSTITGKGSVGGVIGHGSCAAWTNVVIEETTVSNNTITSTGSSIVKAGAVMGTIGAAGQPTTVNGVTNTGGMSVSATVAANTVKSNGTKITTIYGRQGTETGMLYVAGGSYDNYPIEKGVAYAAPAKGYKIVENNGTYGIVEDPEYGKVAKVGDACFETLALAVAAVEDGGTITLIANETFTKNNRYNNGGYWDGLGYSGDKSFTIDLAGFTISQDGALNDYLMWFKNDGAKANTITLKNGTLDAGTTAYCALATASSNAQKITVNLENIQLINNNSSGATLKIRGSAELNANAGTIITGKNSYLGIEAVGKTTVVNIYEGAEIYQNGTSSYCGCLAGVSGNGTINVYGGKGQSKSGGFIAMTSGGTINIEGGEWTANTDGTYANGNKSVLVAQSDKGAKSVVNVTGGTFKGGYNCYGNKVGDAQINIKGGNFNAEPTSYVAEDYIAVKNNGVWNVELAAAKIGTKAYATFADALAAVKGGDTLTLLADLNMSEILVLDKAITLDGNGKTLTSTAARAINVSDANGVTIKNLTINASGERAINVIQNATNVTIENVTATAANYTVNLAGSATAAVVAIKNSTLNGLCTVNVAAAGANVTIDNSTVNCNDNNTTAGESYAALSLNKEAVGGSIVATNSTVNVAEGSDSMKGRNGAENGTVTINGSTEGVAVMVAAITYSGSNYYHAFATIEDAVKFAKEGETITLIRDVTVAEKITIAKSITLDGNDKTLTYTGSDRAIDVPAADGVKLEVTIKNLTVDCTSSYCQRGINYNEDGKLTLEGVTVKGTNVTYALNLPGSSDNCEVAINNSSLTGNIALNVWGENSTINAKNTTFTAVDNNTEEGYAAVKLNNDGTTSAEGSVITITGGKIDVTGSACTDTEATSNGTSTGKINISESTVVNGKNAEMVAVIRYADGNSYSFMTIEDAIEFAKAGDVITLIRDVTMDYNARDAYETQAQNVVINGNGKTLTLNQKNSDWASIGLANNSKLVLNNMTIEKTGYGDTSGAWNTHAIIFTCPVEMNDVTVNNSIAVQAGAALTDVTINEANGYYGLWINGNGQEVTINGGAINATNGGRGIKIADQYIDAPAQVTLNVTDTKFTTVKKAAVLVSSKAGANITASNVDIANVAEDSENFVWVDEDWAEYFSEVKVTGATVRPEGDEGSFAAAITANGAVQAYYKTLAEAIAASTPETGWGGEVTLLKDVTLEGGYADAGEGLRIEKSVTINGAGYTIYCGKFTKGIRIYQNGDLASNVMFMHTNIVNNNNQGRCIDTRSGKINLMLNGGVNLTAHGTNSQPLTIGGSEAMTKVTISGGTIDAGTSGYGVICFVPVTNHINVQGNAVIKGLAAFYLKEGVTNTAIKLSQSTSIGTNKYASASGVFGAVVIEGSNNAVRLEHSGAVVKAVAADGAEMAAQAAFLVRGEGNTINILAENAQVITEGKNAYRAIVNTDVAASAKMIEKGNELKLVAENRGYQFYSFEEAVRFAGNEGTIKVVNDFELAEVWTVAEGQNITLDLNGKTLSTAYVAGSTTNHLYAIHNYGELTITDSSDAKTGKISARGIFNYGNMTLTSGTINAIDGNGGYGVRNYAGATFTMNGGTIATTYEDGDVPGEGYDASPVRVDEGATFTMNDGVINNVSNYTVAIDNYGTTIINGGKATTIHTTLANSGTMIIEGGEFTCNGLEGITAHVIWATDGSTTTINGGTFDGKDNYNGFNVDASEGANVVIKGGNFLPVHSGSLYGDGTITVSGGTFFDKIDDARCVVGFQAVANEYGTYTVKETGCRNAMTIVDGEVTEFVNEKDIKVGTLTYTRSFSKYWTPFYVPFEVPVSMLADKFYVARINDVRRTDNNNDGELDDFDMEIIFIHGGNANGSSKTLKANYPYFICSKSDSGAEMNITLNNATLYAAKENTFDCTTMTEKFEIKGVYSQIQSTEFDTEFDYIVGLNEEGKHGWIHIAEGSFLNPFRFYMTMSSRFEDEPVAPMKSMRITVRGEEDENGATIIYDVVEDNLNNNGNDFIYDLQGRRVSEPKKGGIYIKNGKKILY